LLTSVLSWNAIAQTQTDTTFTPTNKFNIPLSNGSISFSTNGTYERATLENSTWNFVNLRLNNSQRPEKLSLRVSVQDSNITITSFQIFSATATGLRLRFTVLGQGKQTFNFGVIPKGGDLAISFNGVFMDQNNGWYLSPDGTLTVTQAAKNVSITYYTVPNAFGNSRNGSTQPFYQQHSAAIITAIAVTITVILTLAINRKNKKPNKPTK
jgi:hypothetical protein